MASAPSKIILFGEHAVVYDKLGISCSVDRRIHTNVSHNDNGIEVELPFGVFNFDKDDIKELYNKFIELVKQENLQEIKKLNFIDGIKIVLGELIHRLGDFNASIKIYYKKNMKGLGTSAAIFSSIIMSVANYLENPLTNQDIIDITNLGETASHGGTPSGIDSNTVINGGVLHFQKSKGMENIKFSSDFPLVVVNSGEKASTAKMVNHVRDQREKNPEKINKILDEIHDVSTQALQKIKKLEEMKKETLQSLGQLMDKNHYLLQQLGISTPEIDKIISIGKKHGAVGAKLTGGGGGGCVIMLGRDKEHASTLVKKLADDGYDAFAASMGSEGLREEEPFKFVARVK